jgi:hypothetical protein
MPASYPTSVKSFTTKSTNDVIEAAHVNDAQDEINAIESDILTNGITLTSGKIKFPAAQASSANVNTLDDYEEGTWVPVVASSGGGTATYSLQAGFYTKQGDTINFWGRVTLATLGTLAAGNVTITGLPIAALGTTGFFGGCTFTLWTTTTAVVVLVGTVQTGAQAVTLRHTTAAATSLTTTTVADLAATTDLIFYGSYKTAT